jgi:hypothetical protein
MELIYFILASFGLTQMLIYGSIFDRIRPTQGVLGKLFKCPMCLGFHSGVLFLFLNPFTELFMFEVSVTNVLILGSISSGASYVLCSIFGDEGIKLEHTRKSDNNQMDAPGMPKVL